MFPEGDVDIGILAPLSWASVIHELLLPEVVILLIQEDLRLSRTDCVVIFRESNQTRVPPLSPPVLQPRQEIKQETIPIDPALLTPRKTTYIDLTTPPPAVKLEELPTLIKFPGEEHGSDIIDLTLDSDSD
jgi:hypothetical protein